MENLHMALRMIEPRQDIPQAARVEESLYEAFPSVYLGSNNVRVIGIVLNSSSLSIRTSLLLSYRRWGHMMGKNAKNNCNRAFILLIVPAKDSANCPSYCQSLKLGRCSASRGPTHL